MCGSSGSGKSTTIALLERFYDPTTARKRNPVCAIFIQQNDDRFTKTGSGQTQEQLIEGGSRFLQGEGGGGGGVVELDGHDIKTLSLSCLRGSMSLVSQEPRLFAGSVADNIACKKRHIRLPARLPACLHACQPARQLQLLLRCTSD